MFVGDIARAFSGLGSGLARGIGRFGRGLKRISELGEGADDLGPGGTPPFVPEGGRRPSYWGMEPRDPSYSSDVVRGPRVIEDFVTAAEDGARESLPRPVFAPIKLPGRHDLPDLPINRGDLPIPALTPAPSLASLRSSPPILPARRDMPISDAAAPPAIAGAVDALAPKMDLDRRNLPIPALPGHPGGPTPYDPVAAAKYDYTMAGAKRDAEGNLIPMSEGGGFKRGWAPSLAAALAGAARGYATTGDVGGAIGGAAAGGAGSLISPQSGREFVFDTMYKPEIEERLERERRNRERANMEIFNQAKLEDLRATTEERRAQAEKLRRPEVSRSSAPQMRPGRNRQTGTISYYDTTNPVANAAFDPYQFQREAPPREPRPPTAAELMTDPETGLSVEETADASYNARGGDQYVFDRLPARTKQILSAGTVMVNGETRGAMQSEIDRATREWESAIERQRKTDLDYTRGVIRRKRIGATKGGKGAAQSSAYKRNVNQLPPLR